MPHISYLIVATVTDDNTDDADAALRDRVADTLGAEFAVFLGTEGEAA